MSEDNQQLIPIPEQHRLIVDNLSGCSTSTSQSSQESCLKSDYIYSFYLQPPVYSQHQEQVRFVEGHQDSIPNGLELGPTSNGNGDIEFEIAFILPDNTIPFNTGNGTLVIPNSGGVPLVESTTTTTVRSDGDWSTTNYGSSGYNSTNSSQASELQLQSQPEILLPPPIIRRNRYIPGKMTICSHCGICNVDLWECSTCKRKFQDDVKLLDDNMKAKTTPLTPKPTKNKSTPKRESKAAQIKSNGRCKSPRTGTVDPVVVKKPRQGGGRRSLLPAEECITLISSDEDEGEPPAKMLKDDKIVESNLSASTNNNKTHKSETELAIEGNKTCQVSLPYLNDTAVGQKISASSFSKSFPKILVTHQSAMGDKPDPEEVIEQIEQMIATSNFGGLFTTVEYTSVRVGNYKYAPTTEGKNNRVIFSTTGILFSIPHSQNKSELVKCGIPRNRILRISAHLRQRLPMVYITTSLGYCSWMRKRLGMMDTKPTGEGYYYCCQDKDESLKYITIIAKLFSDSDVASIKKIYGQFLDELDFTRANEVLKKVAPNANESLKGQSRPGTAAALSSEKLNQETMSSSVASLTSSAITRGSIVSSTSGQQTVIEAPALKVDCSVNHRVLVYRGLSILQQDITCLADEQFLNDSIIDFWMQYIKHELLNSKDQARTYMFSTFFYKRLTTKGRKNDPLTLDRSKTAAEKRHARVQRWTKDVDIFDQDFLIIPINENCHWFLAVICYPGVDGAVCMETDEPIMDYVNPKKKKSVPLQPEANVPDIKHADLVPNLDLIKPESSSKTNTNNPRRVKQPCIIILDSLAGEARGRVFATLREYLRMEYKTRKGNDKDFKKTSMPACMPKVPQQPNHCDCGIFLLYYVECFFKKPIRSFDFPILKIDDWCTIPWVKKREEIYNTIYNITEETNRRLIPSLTFQPPEALAIREKGKHDLDKACENALKQQIKSAPISKIENTEDDPADVDVDGSFISNNIQPENTTILVGKPNVMHTVFESSRASRTDINHDHDYIPKSE